MTKYESVRAGQKAALVCRFPQGRLCLVGRDRWLVVGADGQPKVFQFVRTEVDKNKKPAFVVSFKVELGLFDMNYNVYCVECTDDDLYVVM